MQMKQQPVGSFGVPPNVQDAAEKARARADQQRKQSEPKQEQEHREDELPKELLGSEDKKAEDTSPIKNLEAMGAKFADEDFQKLLFKGYYETEIDIVKGRMKATFKTLLGSEYDEIDEIMATEVKEINMTNEGFETRRAVLIVSYGVAQLNGRPLVKPVLGKDGKVDNKATALERRKLIGALAPAVTNLLIQKHGAITVAVNAIVRDPENFVKNS